MDAVQTMLETLGAQEARQALQAEAVAGMSPYCSRLVGMLDDSHAPEPQVRRQGSGLELGLGLRVGPPHLAG